MFYFEIGKILDLFEWESTAKYATAMKKYEKCIKFKSETRALISVIVVHGLSIVI